MTKVKGPKKGKIIKTTFDGKEKSLFPSLSTTKDLVLLSIVGNEYCSGEYLEGIVQQAITNHKQDKSGKTTFLVADELYWHNLKGLTSSPDEIHKLKEDALTLGDDFINQNLGSFLTPLNVNVEIFNRDYVTVDEKVNEINRLAEQKGLNFEIVRWRDWVTQDVNDKMSTMKPLYDSIEPLKLSLDKTVDDFAKRHSKSSEESTELWRERSRDYLTEECPAVMWLAASLGYNFIIYPGPIPDSFTATKEYFVVKEHAEYIANGVIIEDTCKHNELSVHVPDPSRLVNWLEVNFRKGLDPKTSKVASRDNFFSKALEQGNDNESVIVNEMRSALVPKKGKSEMSVPDALKDPTALSALFGIAQGIALECGIPRRLTFPSKSSELTEIFQGITQGILSSPIPPQAQLDLLLGLVNNFIKSNQPSAQLMGCSR